MRPTLSSMHGTALASRQAIRVCGFSTTFPLLCCPSHPRCRQHPAQPTSGVLQAAPPPAAECTQPPGPGTCGNRAATMDPQGDNPGHTTGDPAAPAAPQPALTTADGPDVGAVSDSPAAAASAASPASAVSAAELLPPSWLLVVVSVSGREHDLEQLVQVRSGDVGRGRPIPPSSSRTWQRTPPHPAAINAAATCIRTCMRAVDMRGA